MVTKGRSWELLTVKDEVFLDTTPLDEKKYWNRDIGDEEDGIDEEIPEVAFTCFGVNHHL